MNEDRGRPDMFFAHAVIALALFVPQKKDKPQRPKVWDPAALRSRNFWGISKPEVPKAIGVYK